MKRINITLKKVDVKFVDTKHHNIIKVIDSKPHINIKCYDNFIGLLTEFTEISNLYFTDMFRTDKEQRMLRARSVFAARPLRSMHLYGKAFDISVFLLGKKYNVFVDKAKNYGFYGISNEPWHFQYCESGRGSYYELEYMCNNYLPLSRSEISEQLKFAGFDDSVNGIKAFQRHACINVDGIAGHETQKFLLLNNIQFNFIE